MTLNAPRRSLKNVFLNYIILLLKQKKIIVVRKYRIEYNEIAMKLWEKAKQFITQDTSRENESKKMAVLIRILCLTLISFFLFMAIGFAWIKSFSAATGDLLLAVLYAMVFFLSYALPKKPLVWAFIIVTTVWAFSMLWLFGPDSSFQIFPPFAIIIFFFASYDSLTYKIAFGLCTFAAYQGMSLLYGNRLPLLVLNAAEHRCVRDCNMFIMILCTCIAAHIFSKDNLKMEKKLIEYNKRLQDKANTDPLTGLNNRGMAMEYLQEFVKKADQMMAGICICDIDHFKHVNDTYGHDAGDLVLKAVANALRSTVGDKGFVARWGGEEFFIAFPDMNGDEAVDVLYKVQSRIRKILVETDGHNISVTMTYGLTEYDKEKTLTENLKEADSKLYAGKQSGRDKIVY